MKIEIYEALAEIEQALTPYFPDYKIFQTPTNNSTLNFEYGAQPDYDDALRYLHFMHKEINFWVQVPELFKDKYYDVWYYQPRSLATLVGFCEKFPELWSNLNEA